jgi:branched-chain amino acid transport system permease protein
MDAFLTGRAFSDFLFGLADGVIISLVALSLVLIWRSTHILNFAQGAMAMFATYLGMGLLTHNVGYWYCVVISVIAGMVIGGLSERLLLRPLYGKPEINPIVVMVGLLLLIEAVLSSIWSTNTRAIPTPVSSNYWQLHGLPLGLSPFAVLTIAVAVGVAAGIGALFKYTNIGLRLRASAVAPEVSRLLGVRVGRMLTLGWILSLGVGSVAAILYTSSAGLTPNAMDGIFVYGFVAAVVGGLESSTGAIVAGLALGMMEAYIPDYYNSNYLEFAVLILLVVVLVIRPQGLFSKKVTRRV